MTLYIQMSEISSSPQLSYNDVSIKVIIAIQYFIMPRMVIFISSHCHTHLHTTIKIRVLSVDLTHSPSIYSLHSPTSSDSIFPSLLSGNWVILNLTIIYRETPSLSVNWLVVTPKLYCKKETQRDLQILLSPFLYFHFF